MPRRRSNRLKTWRQPHGNRLQIGRQRRIRLAGMAGRRRPPTAPRQRRFRTWHFPTSACVMLETRLIEGMLLGRSAECCRSHQQRCTGLRAALQLKQLSCEVQPRGESHTNAKYFGQAVYRHGDHVYRHVWGRQLDWNLEAEYRRIQSTPPATNPITSLTVVYEAVDGGVKVTATGQVKDGTAINYSSTDKYDGKEYPATGAPWDTISMKQINANTFTVEVRKTGGKYHSTGRTVISKDGKSMTTTTKGTDAEGNPTSGTAIYEKQ